MTTTNLAQQLIQTLRAQEPALRREGVRHLALFGSIARGDANPASDVDLVAQFDPAAGIDLVRLVGLERQLAETLGRRVEILPEPIENPRLRTNIQRDRIIAF
jgi:uncharacterized protein